MISAMHITYKQSFKKVTCPFNPQVWGLVLEGLHGQVLLQVYCQTQNFMLRLCKADENLQKKSYIYHKSTNNIGHWFLFDLQKHDVLQHWFYFSSYFLYTLKGLPLENDPPFLL